MRKSFLKTFGYFVCLTWSGVAAAVGFGGINITSSLGQPLAAEIELVAVEQADKASLSARLASADAFKGAGIDYPYALPKLKFAIETRSNGEFYIKATSTQPVNEPFVSLLIELNWASGRLLREYTFLLDPPGFVAEQPAPAAVQPIEPVVVAPVVAPAPVPLPVPAPQAAVVAAAETPQPETMPQVVSAPAPAETVQATEAAPAPVAEESKAVEPAPVAEPQPAAPAAPAPAKQAVAPAQVSETGVTVKRGDTLSKIANKTKEVDVSLERMLVALYRANAEAFDGKNMNRLRVGKILRLPQSEEVGGIQQVEAEKEVRAQVADWNAYRQQLAAATGQAGEQRAKQEVSGKISTSVQDKAPAAKESAKEVLKLSKGEAPGDRTSAGGKAKDKAAKEEESVAKGKALQEAEQRAALLEKNIKDMQRLVELKNQAAAAAAASAPAASSAVAPAAASAVAVVKPVVLQPKEIAPPPSMLDEILGNPIYLGAGAAVLLGLVGLGYTRFKAGKTSAPRSFADEAGNATGRIAAPVVASPDTGDFTSALTPAPDDAAAEVDPIREADVFLSFGRDVQAEEVLKDALEKELGNNPVKLKLLSIYAERKDTKSFYVYAMEIKESGDEAAWEQAAAMGRELEPNNALYGGSGETVAAEVGGDAALPAVDFDLGLGENTPAPAEQTIATFDIHSALEPEASLGEKTVILSAADLLAAQEAPMDFDVTSTHSGIQAKIEEEPKLDIPAMDFDVTGIQPEVKAEVAEEPKLDIAAMDFDIGDIKVPAPSDVPQPVVEAAPALELDDLVFEAPTQAAAAPEVSAVPAPAEDPGLEFSIDIPTETKPEAAAKPAAPVKDMGLADISLNLDDLTAPEVAIPAADVSEVRDERWQEVATKLDLAKAYQEMGDQAGAREILEEVLRDGDEKQQATAQELLQQLA